MQRKILVAYFSASGTTKRAAKGERINGATEGALKNWAEGLDL